MNLIIVAIVIFFVWSCRKKKIFEQINPVWEGKALVALGTLYRVHNARTLRQRQVLMDHLLGGQSNIHVVHYYDQKGT